jgi:hypothetical protein
MTKRHKKNRAIALAMQARIDVKRSGGALVEMAGVVKPRPPKVVGTRWVQMREYVAAHIRDLRKAGFTYFEEGESEHGPLPYFIRFGK